jgi:endonuclease YncB( thermonuclease family)
MRIFTLSALSLFCALLFGCESQKQVTPSPALLDNQIRGPVTHVRDGDTIEVAGIPVRLSGLTCDEKGTPLGKAGTKAMSELVKGEQITCSLTGNKSYDREIGRCSLPDGQDLGAVLISQSVCGRCNRYDPKGTYVAIQSLAGKFAGKIPKYCSA